MADIQNTIIHDTGTGADRLTIRKREDCVAYTALLYNEAGSCVRNLFFYGKKAQRLRDKFDDLEKREPDANARDIWMRVLAPYMRKEASDMNDTFADAETINDV